MTPVGHEGWAPTQGLNGHWASAIWKGEQGVHRKVESEELEARFRAVTKRSQWGQLEPVGQVEDAEPAQIRRRHILDKSTVHGVCGQHGTISVRRLTRGSLVRSDGNGVAGRKPHKGNRNWQTTPMRGGTRARTSEEARVMPRDPSPRSGRGCPTPKGRGTVRRGEARRVM